MLKKLHRTEHGEKLVILQTVEKNKSKKSIDVAKKVTTRPDFLSFVNCIILFTG